MLIDFKVGNYRSIKEPVSLSLSRVKSLKEPALDKTVLIRTDKNDLELLKAAVVYGANGSGKSNLLKAFSFMKKFVRTSFRETLSGDPIAVMPFAFSEDTLDKPSIFQVMLFLDGAIYCYGFAVTKNQVVEEWLEQDKKKLFRRRAGKGIQLTNFPEGKGLSEKTRGNSLFLSVCAQNNGPISSLIAEFFGDQSTVFTGICELCYLRGHFDFLNNYSKKKQVLQFMNDVDTGITDILYSNNEDVDLRSSKGVVRNRPRGRLYDGSSITTVRRINGRDYQLDLREESEGTQKLLSLSGSVLDALENGKTLVIDEFDARLHPILAAYLVKLFCSPKNSKGAQLIITVHDANLLRQDFLRRDQFWFTGEELLDENCDKYKEKKTELFSLAEYKVRKDASYDKDYLGGRYGCVPNVPAISLRELVYE